MCGVIVRQLGLEAPELHNEMAPHLSSVMQGSSEMGFLCRSRVYTVWASVAVPMFAKLTSREVNWLCF